MTETDWLACSDPKLMLKFVNQQSVAEYIGISKEMRKELLFGCACCWQVRDYLLDARSVEAVRVAEQLADGVGDADMQEKWFWLIQEIAEEQRACHGDNSAIHLAACLVNLLFEESSEIATWAYEYLLDLTPEECRAVRQAWSKQVVHCIWGLLPFRHQTATSSWLTWNEGMVVKLAHGIYEEEAFDRMPVLADALEEAGCDNADILAHCRQPGVHVLGCWVLDLILGKE